MQQQIKLKILTGSSPIYILGQSQPTRALQVWKGIQIESPLKLHSQNLLMQRFIVY